MALSSCPKCGNHSFEVETVEPMRSNFKLNCVQCSSCGTVVGVLEYLNIGAQILKQNIAIKRIARALNVSVDLPE